MPFQPAPPAGLTPSQVRRIEAIKDYLKQPGAFTYSTKYNDERYSNGAIFLVFAWEPTDAPAGSSASIYLSGSCTLIVGPRGSVEVCDYWMGTSKKPHRLLMAQHIAIHFRGKVSKSFS